LWKNRLAALALHQNVEHGPVLIDRAPEITEFALDANEHRIEEPVIAWTRTAALRCVCEEPTASQTLLSNGLVADHGVTCGQDQLDVAQAQAEAVT
jgi:hypothetical protein